MSLTSYQAAPPRVLENEYDRSIIKSKQDVRDNASDGGKLAPAVGFEPTTNRLTADRSTTELRWIV